MKGLAITYKGIEEISALEIKEILGVESSLNETAVTFDCKDVFDLAKLAYKAQSLIKVIQLLDSFEFKTDEDIIKHVSKIDFSFIKGSFLVKSKRIGQHDFSSQDIAEEAGKEIYDKYKFKVDLKNPDFLVYLYVYENKCYIGIDFTNFDLSKRQYRVFSHVHGLKANVAYALLRLVGYDKTKILLDPFCGGGTIPIEAALYVMNFSVNYFNKDKFSFDEKFFDELDKEANLDKELKIFGTDKLLKEIKNSEKNEKIAGIPNKITFSKCDVGWMDTKFEKEKIDLIVTFPPITTKFNEKKITKVYDELFYQAEFVLVKNGKMLIVTNVPDVMKKYAEKRNFKIEKELQIEQGKRILDVLVLVKYIK